MDLGIPYNVKNISWKGWSLVSALTHHLVLYTFLPQHMGLKGDKHLMISSIELQYETMKEIQISEGENYKYENLVILKCLSLKHA